MDLQQEWQNMNTEIASKNKEQHTWKVQLDAKSNSLMQSLLFKLKWKLRWIRIIDLPILAIALFLKGDIQLLLIGFFLSYELFRVFAMREFNKIKTGVDYGSTTIQVLENNVKAITTLLKIENIFGYIFLPITAPLGAFSAKLYRHHTFENAFNHMSISHLLPFILISIALIWVAKKMNNSIFKAPIKELESKIEELKN
jgi:hypothetical protein